MNSRKLKITGAFTSLVIILFAFQHCGKQKIIEIQSVSSALTSPPTSVSIETATADLCSEGGIILNTFIDNNLNGKYDNEETITNTQNICNGVKGSNGTDGKGGGIQVSAAASGACSAGGITVKTYVDLNNNGIFDSAETFTSSSTICNGTSGSDGKSSELTVTSATSAQCANGGVVYTSSVTGENAQSNVICNGLNGTSATVTQKVADEKQCPTGGTVIQLTNDGSDPVYSVICNGVTGASAYITTTVASPYQCKAGGVVISTWTDAVNPKAEIVCNGLNGDAGAAGSNPKVATSTANEKQCPAGGVVVTTTNPSEKEPVINIICNGTKGTDAEKSGPGYITGIVGPMIEKKNLSACHHDFLYFPATNDTSNGWLAFRHQKNGSEDQGIGSTGFNIWNVDITNFSLVSEVGGVTYCNLTYDPKEMILKYTVVDKTDGLAGKSGVIKLK